MSVSQSQTLSELVSQGFIQMDLHNCRYYIHESGLIYDTETESYVEASIKYFEKQPCVSIKCRYGSYTKSRRKPLYRLVYSYFVEEVGFQEAVRLKDESMPISISNLEVYKKNSHRARKSPEERRIMDPEGFYDWGGDAIYC